MAAPREVRRVKSVEKQVWTPQDNLAQHRKELLEIGATEEDLKPLIEAARQIELAEEAAEAAKQASADLTNLTGPFTTRWGWVIQPPTTAARRWASAAMTALTNGAAPESDLGQVTSMLAALWVLREWGDGRKLAVSSAVLRPATLAEMIFSLVDEVIQCAGNADGVAEDFCAVMGIDRSALLEEVKKKALQQYDETLAGLRQRLGIPRS